MHFLTKLFGGEKTPAKPRERKSPEEEARLDALVKQASGRADYTDPTGNLSLRLTPEGHVDATGQLEGAGQHKAQAAWVNTDKYDPTGKSPTEYTHDGKISMVGYELDDGTREILDQFRAAQANERMNGKPTEQQTAPKTTGQAQAVPSHLKQEIL